VTNCNKNKNNNIKKFERFTSPFVGIMSLMIWRFIVSMLIHRSGLSISISDIPRPSSLLLSSPCVGFEFDIFFFVKGHQGDELFPPLCIT
jgi:hypothetical protein